MTEHPITPPSELVQQRINEEQGVFAEHIATLPDKATAPVHIVTVKLDPSQVTGSVFIPYSAIPRRPKPPSLKEQALEEVGAFEGMGTCNIDIIRRALEQLND